MAGPFSIQRVPQGLLSLLGMKGTGRNPDVLNESVVPTLEQVGFYTDGSLEFEEDVSVGIFTAGVFSSLVVPDGEIWALKGVNGQYSGAAGAATATAMVGLLLQAGNINQAIAIARLEEQPINAGEVLNFGHWFESPQFLFPGTSVIAINETTLANLVSLRVTAYFRRLQA